VSKIESVDELLGRCVNYLKRGQPNVLDIVTRLKI
jgi:hypothetical protein